MPLGDHLEELRRRLIFAFLGLLPIFGLSLAIAGPMIRVLTAPLEARLDAADLPVRVIQTSPTESFGAYIKVAVVLTIIVGLPWMFYQFWLFISPGLLPREKRFIHLLIPASGFLSAARGSCTGHAAGGAEFLHHVQPDAGDGWTRRGSRAVGGDRGSRRI